jgi:hypothetical protein
VFLIDCSLNFYKNADSVNTLFGPHPDLYKELVSIRSSSYCFISSSPGPPYGEGRSGMENTRK